MQITLANVTAWLRATSLLLLAGQLIACATPPATADSRATADSLNFEGLETVKVRRFDVAQVRPGADFSIYTDVLLTEPQLAYRTPDSASQQFPLTPEQKDAFAMLVTEVFTAEIDAMTSPALATKAGPNVLELGVRLVDIAASVPPRSVAAAGRASIALRAVGDVTLVIELRDSQSRELLARVVDTKAVEGVAIASDNELLTRWEDVEAVCRRWARIVRQGLTQLLGDN